jgi:hypothetical protein
MAELHTGEVTFHDSTDVALGFGGGSDDAGFVQVVQGRTGNVERMREMNAQPLTSPLWQLRPDLTGWILALHGGGYFTQAFYFTSEQPAREGEGREPSPEMKAQLDEEMSSMLSDTTFHDLREQRVPLATGSPSQRPTRRMEAGPHLPTDRRHDRRAPGRPRRPTRTRSHRRRLNVGSTEQLGCQPPPSTADNHARQQERNGSQRWPREKPAERSSPGISSRIHHDRGTRTGEPRSRSTLSSRAHPSPGISYR